MIEPQRKEDAYFDDKSRDDAQKLFLLEVLVDNLFIQTDSSSLNVNKDLAENMADTCVMFQFLHYPPLVVCESDFIGTATSNKDTAHITFKSGKSCFFSLRTPKGPILPVPFDVSVTVIRKMKEGVLPDKLEVGKTSIDLGENFTELLKQNTDESFCDTLPISKIKKGTFDIKDKAGKIIGNLTAFLRLSCFGKLIITQFSLNKEDEKTYLFKGTDIKEICQNELGVAQPKDRGEGQGQDRRGSSLGPITPGKEGACYCPPDCKGPNQPRSSPSQQGPVDYRGGQGQGSVTPPWGNQQGQGNWGQNRPPYGQNQGQAAWGNIPPYGPPYGPSQGPAWAQNRPPYGQSQGSAQMPVGTGRGKLCDCSYPIPAGVMDKYAPKGKGMELSPGEVGMQDDQVIFQLPLKKPGDPVTDKDKQLDSQVYYKLTSAEETKEGVQKNTVNIKSDDIPGMVNKQAVSPVSGLPADDKHDVFLLKIGKKCEGDKKRNLELELRTPKMKEPKPPMSDKDTQYLESDIPKSSKKGSKDKGKGKGGKGKGKGKKSK